MPRPPPLPHSPTHRSTLTLPIVTITPPSEDLHSSQKRVDPHQPWFWKPNKSSMFSKRIFQISLCLHDFNTSGHQRPVGSVFFFDHRLAAILILQNLSVLPTQATQNLPAFGGDNRSTWVHTVRVFPPSMRDGLILRRRAPRRLPDGGPLLPLRAPGGAPRPRGAPHGLRAQPPAQGAPPFCHAPPSRSC